MSIKIKIPQYLRDKTGGESFIDIEGNILRECLVALVDRYPALNGEIVDGQGMLLLKWSIFVNGKLAIGSDELSYPVADGDVILLVPTIAGG